MLYIDKDTQIRIEWTITKGNSPVKENFDRALVKVFLIGSEDKYLVDARSERGMLVMDVQEGMPTGVYSVETIWVKNINSIKDCRYDSRSIQRSRVDNIYAVTDYDTEVNYPDEDGTAVVKIQSKVATYGYDGLSAYEIAVLRGDFNGSESEWLKWVHQGILDNVKDLLDELKHRDTRFVVQTIAERDKLEDVKEGDEVYVVSDGMSYVLKMVDGQKTWERSNVGSVISKLAFQFLCEKMPEFIADRAIADENGKRIIDEYLTREAVRNFISETFNRMFVDNPPYIMDGYVTEQMLSDSLKQLIQNSGEKNITNYPDEEDLTTENGIMKFKDKKHNPNTYSGMGRKYLRKNMVNGVNVLTQKMIDCENTIYVIQYDYDLQGAEITVPNNCVLQFEGGSLSNGTLVGNNTIINAGLEKILSSDITINGTYNIDSIYPEWFYAGTGDYSNAIQSCISLSKISTTDNNINILFCSGKNYNIGKPILIDTIRINLLGNNCSLIKITSETGEGTFTEGGNNIDLSLNCFFYTNRNMYYINISDFNLLVLDSELQNNVYGFFFPYINRSTIKNIKSYYLYEGLTTIDSWQNIFENIVFDYCSNCGFNISGGTSTFINKCWVTHSDTSYKISNLYYSILNCTASDFSKTSYNIQNCCITLNGCGCELTDNSFAVLTSGARVLLNNFFFVGDNNIDKEVFAFIGDSYIEFNNSEIRNTYKLLKCMESKVVINNCNISNWEIGFNSGIIIRTEKDKKLIFREEFGNNWSVLEFYNNIFSSDNRPNLTEYDISVEIYDSTLKKKILWNGTDWTNLDGTPLE